MQFCHLGLNDCSLEMGKCDPIIRISMFCTFVGVGLITLIGLINPPRRWWDKPLIPRLTQFFSIFYTYTWDLRGFCIKAEARGCQLSFLNITFPQIRPYPLLKQWDEIIWEASICSVLLLYGIVTCLQLAIHSSSKKREKKNMW